MCAPTPPSSDSGPAATTVSLRPSGITERGWALIDQELEEGLRSLAAPIRDSDGTVVAAVNVATHAGRRSLDSIVADLLSPLLATAERIERDLASARTTTAAAATGERGRAT